MKLFIITQLLFLSVQAFANESPECRSFGKHWKEIRKNQDSIKTDDLLTLLRIFPGEAPNQLIHPDWQGTAREKLKIIYAVPFCDEMGRAEIARLLINRHQGKAVIRNTFEQILLGEQNASSYYSMVANWTLLSFALEKKQFHLNELQNYEFFRIRSDLDRHRNEFRLRRYNMCDEPNRCSEDFAAKTLEQIEYEREEEMRIHHEFVAWVKSVQRMH